jgi:hypothetical protein
MIYTAPSLYLPLISHSTIKSDIFNLGASKDITAQFTRSVKNIANYVHHHYFESSDIAAAIKTLTKATILISLLPQLLRKSSRPLRLISGGAIQRC